MASVAHDKPCVYFMLKVFVHCDCADSDFVTNSHIKLFVILGGEKQFMASVLLMISHRVFYVEGVGTL